jgi:hypothetical protein
MVAFGVFGGLVALLQWGFVERFLAHASYVPFWARHLHGPLYYARRYYNEFPLLFMLLPLASIYMFSRFGKYGMFVLGSFFAPLAIHSLVFPMKQERYVFHLLPFFAMILAPFLNHILATVYSVVGQAWKHRPRLAKIMQLMAFAAFLGPASYPWLAHSAVTECVAPWADWKKFYLRTGRKLDPAAALMTTSPLAVYHYFSRVPDFLVQAAHSPGSMQYATGAPQVRTLDDLIEATQASELVYLITPAVRYRNDACFTDEMRAYVEDHYQTVSLPYASRIRLYKARRDRQSTKRTASPEPADHGPKRMVMPAGTVSTRLVECGELSRPLIVE